MNPSRERRVDALPRYIHSLTEHFDPVVVLVILLIGFPACSSRQPVQETRSKPSDVSQPRPPDQSRARVLEVTDRNNLRVRYENGYTEKITPISMRLPHSDLVLPSVYEGIKNNQAGRDCLSDWVQNKRDS